METAKLRKTLTTYLIEIQKRYLEGDLREESFYSTVERLFEAFSPLLTSEEEIIIRALPKRTEVGIPDFLVRRNGEIIGHIEAKTLDTNLCDVEKSEQIRRYCNALPNLILTNFLDFWLYRDGTPVNKVKLCSLTALEDAKHPTSENIDAFIGFIEQFFAFSIPEIKSASELAVVLAKKTQFSRAILEEVLANEKEPDSLLKAFYEIFRDTLIEELTEERFVDLYAQTITYGLFAAKMMAREQEIDMYNAWKFIPRNVPLLTKIFYSFSGPNTLEPLSWVIDDIVRVLNKTDIVAVRAEIRTTHMIIDPIIHFYETFLATYNPSEREHLGVYYTPLPVVSYIVRAIHDILKETFGKEKGLAEDDVRLLDPAAGTLTFIIRAIREVLRELESRDMQGLIPSYIEQHIFQHFFAFELLMVPYIIGHLRLSLVLEREWGYVIPKQDRFNFYLTNTLEMRTLKRATLLPELTQEAEAAEIVKEDVPILVILGNPPYSGISENKGKWITDLIEDYKYVDGQHFGEKKHWLQDDYVKFIRFGQWKIDRTGEGILGFITNHSYLDNPTFRGMRQSLMQSFDEIYVLNLHGNSLKKEKCPDGSKDKNVFDIQQGVAITLFIKRGGDGGRNARVFYAERWGLREEKYRWLLRNDISTTYWEELQPTSPFYFFVPMEESLRKVYENFWKITDIFMVGVTGVITARDKFVIDFDKEVLRRRIVMFRDLSLSDDFVRKRFGLKENYMWKIKKARNELSKVEDWEDNFTEILYRPFDIRQIYFHNSVVWRTRKEVMRHMMQENLGLITPREFKEEPGAFVTERITGHKTVSAYDINYIFPLYIYSNVPKERMPEEKTCKPDRTPNFSSKYLQAVKEALGKEPTPEENFYYIYALLYSPIYRERYEEFLKIDFPRIPLPTDYEQFLKLSALGKELIELHLLKHPSLAKPDVRFPVTGPNMVEKIRYEKENERIYFNKTQYFESIPKAAWEYQIGGYQVLAKYLKDRKKRELTKEEIEHYMEVAKAIKKTMEIQKEIGEVFI